MGKKTKRGRCVTRNRQLNSSEPDELKNAPHSFVMHRGPVGRYIRVLTSDFKKVMEPFTAKSLKPRKTNRIKDFVAVSGLLHVSHMFIFTQTEQSPYLKILRLPRGPTLTFKILNYSFTRDILSAQKKTQVIAKSFMNSPLVVLNSFTGEGMQLKLMASMFQNMFPSINVRKVNLNTIKRCVLMNYNPVSKLIDFRHYSIKVMPVGISKSVKKMIQNKVPNLGQFNDISEFMTKAHLLSESEYEDDPASHVILPHDLLSQGNVAATKSGIRVYELGPRMTLQLIKVEGGLMSGEVLFHELYHLTEEEKLHIKKKREKKLKLKEKRKKIQEENKKKKELMKEEHKKKSLEGMKRVKQEEGKSKESVVEEAANEEQDDDVEWYRKEVGEEPDKELFGPEKQPGQKRKFLFHSAIEPHKKKKKQKLNEDQTEPISDKSGDARSGVRETKKKWRKNKVSVPSIKDKYPSKGKRKLNKKSFPRSR